MAKSKGYRVDAKSARAIERLLGKGGGSGTTKRGIYTDRGFSRVRLAQAPVAGIPARVGITPGSATCTAVMIAPTSGSGYSAGDLIKTTKTFTVLNWDFQIIGADGDRVIQVSSHSDGSQVVGTSCTNEADPALIILYTP